MSGSKAFLQKIAVQVVAGAVVAVGMPIVAIGALALGILTPSPEWLSYLTASFAK